MKILIVTVIIIFATLSGNAQVIREKSRRELKAERKAMQIKLIRQIIESKAFVFKANAVITNVEKTRALTSDYGIEIRNDSVFSYMPYYGTTYSTDYSDYKDSPMGFIQPVEKYKRDRTKSGFDIYVTVKNERDVINLKFHVSKTGAATVSASSINRESIIYVGEILAPLSKMD